LYVCHTHPHHLTANTRAHTYTHSHVHTLTSEFKIASHYMMMKNTMNNR